MPPLAVVRAVPLVSRELLLESVVESAPIAIDAIDLGGNVVVWNRAAEQLYGWSAEEVLGRPLAALFSDGGAEREIEHVMRRLRDGERTVELEATRRRKDGAPLDVALTISPVFDERGILAGASAVARDVGELRREQADLRERLFLYDRAQETAHVGSWAWSSADDTITWSTESYRIFGAAPGVGMTLVELFHRVHPDDRARVQERFLAALERDEPYDVEFRAVRPDGAIRWVHARATVIRDVSGAPLRLVGVNFDVTERMRTQQALAERDEQLRQAQKMEAIGILAGGVAHDFNNLLTVILTYCSLLLEQCAEGSPMREDIGEVKEAAERARDLTAQLLAFSRRQVLQPTVLQIDDVVRGLEKMLRRLLGEDVALYLHTASHAHVHADRGQLEQVVMNLAVNARDAMPDGGTLTIETSVVDLGATSAPLDASAPGSYVRLVVADTGIGMDAATRARIFEPFFTTKGQGRGTGLGLSTVFGIVAQSGGTIDVASEVGRGTRFEILLPRSDREVERGSDPGSSPDVPGDETILLVEDDDQVRAVLGAVLRRLGYEVLEARNAGDALLACEQEDTPIDLMITDVVMPRMSGPQLAVRVATLRPEMKTLYMSGYTDSPAVREAVRRGELSFLQKPITPDVLARRVRRALDARSRRTNEPPPISRPRS